ncbi:cytidine deaminase family protein [Pseudarthrobacter sp. BRE9]|uniref:cytidine deaminase family protein n=1 Tax=Pseudarthrobacter sp. BRE9 TaxID=2962582 RepID=UPI0037C8BA32
MEDFEAHQLLKRAWAVRANAAVRGNRRVGASVLASNGQIYVGCNIQQKYHIGDVHAEVAAITAMVSMGGSKFSAIVVVSDGDGVPPCGACRDWILQFGAPDCIVLWCGENDGSSNQLPARDLMPYPPSFMPFP